MSPLPWLAAVLLGAAAPGPAAPAARPARTSCIQLSAGAETHYTPVDDHTIVVQSFSDWWKLTTTPSTLLLDPQSILVNDIHGSSSLCSPLDFQLTVLDRPGGGREGLIVQSFESITPAEGRALLKTGRR